MERDAGGPRGDPSLIDRFLDHLRSLYPEDEALDACDRLLARMEESLRRGVGPSGRLFDETDVLLIAYPDHVTEPGRRPLETLHDALIERVRPPVTGLHLLPHYPWTSDDGFAVVDPREVAPEYGTWDDVRRLAGELRLMLDAVVNHVSASSPWFRGWCEGDPRYRDFFIAVDPATDLSEVTRPRATALVTPVETVEGTRHVWTTFGPDQIDLNYANPEVLLTVTDVLLGYVEAGASMLRLDAAAFLWKRPGTACINLEETHRIIRLWRTIMDAVAPGTLIVTETNIPHDENVSYFGSGDDEAHLVYQFPLPPLVLAAFHDADTSVLRRWIAALETPSRGTTFLNFLSSHDGIGLRPAEGILSPESVARLCEVAVSHGGGVSHRRHPDGSESAYEINATLFDALLPADVTTPGRRDIDRAVAAHAIMLALAGVPALYLNAVVGDRNWHEGVERSGRLRTVNRRRFDRAELERTLDTSSSLSHEVLSGVLELVAIRSGEPAFHPAASQRILPSSAAVLVLERTATDGTSSVICAHEVSGAAQTFSIPTEAAATYVDLVDASEHGGDGRATVALEPYGVRWLRRTSPTR
jgi:glucosylglycerate phosphorylase